MPPLTDGSDSDEDMYGSDDNLDDIINGSSDDELYDLNPEAMEAIGGTSGDTNDSWEDIEVHEENL